MHYKLCLHSNLSPFCSLFGATRFLVCQWHSLCRVHIQNLGYSIMGQAFCISHRTKDADIRYKERIPSDRLQGQ